MAIERLSLGGSLSGLDIYFKDSNTNSLINVNSLTFLVQDPNGIDTVLGNGVNSSVGFYNASGTIPSNGLLGNWTITWTAIFPGGGSGLFTETFEVQNPNILGSFEDSSNHQESIFDRTRLDLGDPNGLIFTDGLLSRMLQKSIARLNRALGLVAIECQSSLNITLRLISTSVNHSTPISINLVTGEITPSTDPYIDLLTLQMEYLIAGSELSALKRLNPTLGGAFGSGLVGMDREGISATNADGVSMSVSPARFTTRAQTFKWDLERLEKELTHAINDFRWRLSCGLDVTSIRYYGGYRYYNNSYYGVF